MANRNKYGETFTAELIEKVWEKAQIVPGFDARYLRKDKCGAMIGRVFFGKSDAAFSLGWEIDHIKPLTRGGTDELVNLQPLHWENNRNKSDSYPSWDCRVSVKGQGNKYVNVFSEEV